MLSVTVKGFKIEAVATGLNETTIYVDGKPYDTYYGNHNEYSQYIRPLADDIRAGFVPFVGWPDDSEDDQIFASGIDWGEEMDKFELHGWEKVPGEASWTLDDNRGQPSAIITSANKYMWTCCILGQTFRYPKTAPLHKVTRQVREAIEAINNRRPNVTMPDNYSLEARY